MEEFKELIVKMLSEASKLFISKHLNGNTNELRLKYYGKKDLPYPQLIEQIEARQRLRKKNDSWIDNSNILFPPKLSLEQSSSDETAKFKSELFKGSSFIDATGGMGIDSYYFSSSFDSGNYCELDTYLCALAEHNFKTLKANISVNNTNGIEFIKNINQQVDLIYLDPARREKGKKLISLSDYQPNVLDHLDLLIDKAKSVLIKASPMLDIKYALNELKCVQQVWVISVNNECKELLFLLNKEWSFEPKIEAINLQKGNAERLTSSESNGFIEYGMPEEFIYEPNASIMKAALFEELFSFKGLKKLHQNTHLFTSRVLIVNFPGRCFKISSIESPFKGSYKKQKLNIITRNFRMNPMEIKKKIKSIDGGARFLIATTLMDDKNVFILAEKCEG